MEPYYGVMGIGSGGHYAQGNEIVLLLSLSSAAAMALIDIEELDAEAIARKAMKIAGDMCVYTNHNLTVEILDKPKVDNASVPVTPPST